MKTDTTSSLMVECPACKHRFPLSGGVLTQVKEEIQAELSTTLKKQESALQARLLALKTEQEAMAKRETQFAAKEEKLESELEKRLKAREETLTSKLKDQARELFQAQIKELTESLSEKSSALKSANEKELALLKQQRELKEAQEALELKVARQIEEERKQIRDAAIKQAQEENRLNLDEKDRLVEELKKQMDALRRKAEQGSQQRQGETLELDIEQILRTNFPVDVIDEVPKGIRGADLVYKVISPTGRIAGSVVIESFTSLQTDLDKEKRAMERLWASRSKSIEKAVRNTAGMFGDIQSLSKNALLPIEILELPE